MVWAGLDFAPIGHKHAPFLTRCLAVESLDYATFSWISGGSAVMGTMMPWPFIAPAR
jgi:hypothetical protein